MACQCIHSWFSLLLDKEYFCTYTYAPIEFTHRYMREAKCAQVAWLLEPRLLFKVLLLSLLFGTTLKLVEMP